MRQRMAAKQGFAKVWDFVSPLGQVPRLNFGAQASGLKTLWVTLSEFRKSTVVPSRTGSTWGRNFMFCWFICDLPLGAKVFPGTAATYTTASALSRMPLAATRPWRSPAKSGVERTIDAMAAMVVFMIGFLVAAFDSS